MASFSANFTSSAGSYPPLIPDLDSSHVLGLGIALSLGIVVLSRLALKDKSTQFPLVRLDKSTEHPRTDKEDYLHHANELLEKGRAQYPDRPFRIISDSGSGETVILPSRMANEIRNVDEFSFMATMKDLFHSSIPGFEPFQAGTRGDQLIQTVTRKQLTKFLNKVTEPLADETAYATDLRFGTSTEWREFHLYTEMLDVVARISTRVFLGDDVCRNEDWLNITKSYTVRCFKAASALRQKSRNLRFILHWFDPQCREVRDYVGKAKRIIAPIIHTRQQVRREALARGEPLPSFNDALDWFEEESKGNPYDPEIVQLTLSMAAIHTTTDLIGETMTNIARNPELFDELRQEIARVLGAEGWKKTALYNLKLLDSVIKETQRLKPIASVAQGRTAMDDVTLSDGTFIPKGTRLACDAGLRLSPDHYDDPLRFDGHRYARWRGTSRDAISHLVSTSPESMGFGHGQHACPGRFFAANEIKVALCHMLMKYDWKLADGCEPRVQKMGFGMNTDPSTRFMMRRREVVELDLDDL